MLAKIEQARLLPALKTVTRAAAQRSTLPVLGHILVQADTENSTLVLACTDLAVAIKVVLTATEVHESGGITVPAYTFTDWVDVVGPGVISISLNERTATMGLECGHSTAHVKGIDAEEFPRIHRVDGHIIKIKSDALRKIIKQVAFAAASDEARPVLCGVLIELYDDMLSMSAADGFRLSKSTVRTDHYINEPIRVIVPARTLREFIAVMGDEDVMISLSDEMVSLQSGNTIVTSKLTPGKYPDTSQVVPSQISTTVTVSKQKLSKSIKTADIFATNSGSTSGGKIVRIATRHELDDEQSIVISAVNAETGDGQSVLNAKVDGEPIEVGFNTKYLREAMSACRQSEITLQMTTPSSSSPVLIEEDGYTHVLMPMHLTDR